MAQVLTEKLEQTRPAEKKRVASVPQRESSWQVRQSRLCQMERNRAICPENQIVRRAFSVREVKKAAAKERKRNEYSSADGQ